MFEDTGTAIGLTALLNMLLTIVLILVSWWALQAFKFDLFLNRPGGAQAKLLHILLSVLIGHTVSNFFIRYMDWSSMLKYLFS